MRIQARVKDKRGEGTHVVNVAIGKETSTASKDGEGSLEKGLALESILNGGLLRLVVAAVDAGLVGFNLRHGCGRVVRNVTETVVQRRKG